MDNMLAPPERMCRIETGTEHTLLDDRDVLLCEDHLQFPKSVNITLYPRLPSHCIAG